LRLQYELDRPQESAFSSDLSGASIEMEQRLRSLLTKYTEVLQSMTVSGKFLDSRFFVQISEIASSLLCKNNLLPFDDLSNSLETSIRIVSIDIDYRDVHQVILQQAISEADIANFIFNAGGLDEVNHLQLDNALDNDENTDISRFISKTHVTMVHSSQISQKELKEKFGMFLGMKFEVSVSGIHLCSTVAALDIADIHLVNKDLSLTGFPSCANSYPHITLWCSSGVKPQESNTLPEKFMNGEATRIIFAEPKKLSGTLSFWKTIPDKE